MLMYVFDAPFSLFVLVAVAGLVLVIRFLPFGAIERVFGYGGLMLFVFLAAALHERPDWGAVANGFVPQAPDSLLYAYFVVGLIAAAVMPYEVYFYSSGAVEERWTAKDLRVNRLNVVFGYGIGPLEEQPEFPGDGDLERRIRRFIRWNAAVMVVKANHREKGIGGWILHWAIGHCVNHWPTPNAQ